MCREGSRESEVSKVNADEANARNVKGIKNVIGLWPKLPGFLLRVKHATVVHLSFPSGKVLRGNDLALVAGLERWRRKSARVTMM